MDKGRFFHNGWFLTGWAINLYHRDTRSFENGGLGVFRCVSVMALYWGVAWINVIYRTVSSKESDGCRRHARKLVGGHLSLVIPYPVILSCWGWFLKLESLGQRLVYSSCWRNGVLLILNTSFKAVHWNFANEIFQFLNAYEIYFFLWLLVKQLNQFLFWLSDLKKIICLFNLNIKLFF